MTRVREELEIHWSLYEGTGKVYNEQDWQQAMDPSAQCPSTSNNLNNSSSAFGLVSESTVISTLTGHCACCTPPTPPAHSYVSRKPRGRAGVGASCQYTAQLFAFAFQMYYKI